jgi:hypothetical protein
VLVFSLLVGGVTVQDVSAGVEEPFERRHQLGVRLGVWSNRGDVPPAIFEDSANAVSIKTDIGSANVYFEGVGSYRLFSHGMLECSFGFVNRGDVTMVQQGREYIGSLVLYPVLVSFKYYFPLAIGHKAYPYVQLGGGLLYGRHSVQFTNDAFFASNSASGTDVNYMAGIGFDWTVANSVALEVNARYMPIEYSKGLILAKDHSAFTIMFGVKYLLKSDSE